MIIATDIIGPLIGAAATLVAAGIGVLGAYLLQRTKSSRYRSTHHLPSPIGTWDCEWYNDAGESHVEDTVKIERWTKKGRFEGEGEQSGFVYVVEGEVHTTRVVTLTYRSEDFPQTVYLGVACLEFSVGGSTLSGHWYGNTHGGLFISGTTTWKRRS